MPQELSDGLHLPSLSIRNFRGIRRLSIERLGRVTLIGGRNGIGKTTILEAARVYAAKGLPRVLYGVLDEHDEIPLVPYEDHGPSSFPDYTSLFSDREQANEQSIEIGPKSQPTELVIQLCAWESLTEDQRKSFSEIPEDCQFLKVTFLNSEILVLAAASFERTSHTVGRRARYARARRSIFDDHETLRPLTCESLGPGVPGASQLARYWDKVALTDLEGDSLQALRLASSDVQRIAVVGDDGERYRTAAGRRVLVRLQDGSLPVPLRSLGDGAVRLFSTALALANSRSGFLVIDEVENGLHYSLQENFWHMVLHAAHRHNVQVLATTHSLDCVVGFARAVAESDGIEGAYVRLDGQPNGSLRAVEYETDELMTVAEQRIEVR